MQQAETALDTLSPTDLSMEAVVELAELQEGLRSDVPALSTLFRLLTTPSPSFQDMNGVSMLADVRSYTLFRDSLHEADPKIKADDYRALQSVMEKFLKTVEEGVVQKDPKAVEVAKRFCSAINASFVNRHMNEIHSRRERADARYIQHESAS